MIDAAVNVGEHCWASCDSKLVVVLKSSDGYSVCGPWECNVPVKDLILLEKIPKPSGYEKTELYYVDEKYNASN